MFITRVTYFNFIHALHRLHFPTNCLIYFCIIIFVCNNFNSLNVCILSMRNLLNNRIKKPFTQASSKQEIFFKSANCSFLRDSISEHTIELWISGRRQPNKHNIRALFLEHTFDIIFRYLLRLLLWVGDFTDFSQHLPLRSIIIITIVVMISFSSILKGGSIVICLQYF